ncbi:TonB-dependent receptor plug domain-containing protein [Halarcobacter ebronensis]|uniref:TonB-dependent receptor n=1 Tax=Halarcobacter ebronensis TaxID=1462615 RepID=A0A4Q1AGS2_9BACT|nr:TonB-dependent receptor [Halarcobacter ebronensis]QKF82982.1 TonB-dependent receptor [Halarcobacter ebronensis]RXK02820.1 TonB-dependent receptor [Halarcobacter ebronensis]
MNYSKYLWGISLLSSTSFAESMMYETIDIYDVVGDDFKNKNILIKEKKQSNNIADFLKDDPEITIKRKSNYGDNGDTLLIRGQGGNRIALNIDGHNINSLGQMGGSYIDFGTISMDNIEKIEVLKGGSSVEYGNVLGGVINAYTKSPEEKPYFSIYGTLGGWDADNYYNIRTSYSQRFGNFGISIGASHQESDEYLWNNDYKSDSISAKLYYFTPNDGELSLGIIHSDTTRGVVKTNRQSTNPNTPLYNQKISNKYPLSLGETFAGESGANRAFSVVGEGANSNKRKNLFDIAYSQPINKNLTIDLSAYANREDRDEKNYADTSLVGGTSLNNGDLVMQRDIEMDRSYGYKSKATITLDNHNILLGVQRRVLRSGENVINFINTQYNGNAGGGGNKNNSVGIVNEGTDIQLDGIFISDTYFLNEKLELNIGARYDNYEIDMPNGGETFTQSEDKISPKLGLVYTPNAKDSYGIYLYQMFRAPGATEAYHYTVGRDALSELESKNLKAEKADALDLIYRHSFSGRSIFQASIFYYDVDDYLLFKTPISGGRYAYNVDNATFFGVSMNSFYEINDYFALKGGFSYQEAKKEGDALDPNNRMDKLDYIPDLKINAGFEWKVTPKIKTDFLVTYIGERYYQRTIDDVEKLSGYTTVDASVQYELAKGAVVELYAENIMDENYEEVFGYPTAGTIIGASFKYVF